MYEISFEDRKQFANTGGIFEDIKANIMESKNCKLTNQSFYEVLKKRIVIPPKKKRLNRDSELLTNAGKIQMTKPIEIIL